MLQNSKILLIAIFCYKKSIKNVYFVIIVYYTIKRNSRKYYFRGRSKNLYVDVRDILANDKTCLYFTFTIHSPWKSHSILSRQSRDAFSGDEIHCLRRLRRDSVLESLSRSCLLVQRNVISAGVDGVWLSWTYPRQ